MVFLKDIPGIRRSQLCAMFLIIALLPTTLTTLRNILHAREVRLADAHWQKGNFIF